MTKQKGWNRILALDPGASFGWALSNTAMVNADWELANYYTPNFKARIGDTPVICGAWEIGLVEDPGERFDLLSRLIAAQEGIDSVFYEVAPGLKGKASMWHLGYLSVSQRITHRISATFSSVNPSTWKRFTLNNGQADKAKIRSTAEQRFGLEPFIPAQDAADALHILAWGLQACQVRKAVN